ncbi:conserved Plasmodium protein, unknown function [Plasmodium ovale curtisi]|uniref:Uncharacterized protein n=1 Tax=Plasmodium ovale curtisi TaxID=864141 RepID=A0A1A8W2L4_PLAOA|nr:conserved Plasmodium protein, unknown function [Plasmodium ovale curtisi]SBS96193.1 conserved Plasmodium protein, unknown function [Plasmodium ovale curtisi]
MRRNGAEKSPPGAATQSSEYVKVDGMREETSMRGVATEVANHECISTTFLIKLYLYNVSKVNIDEYLNWMTLVKEGEKYSYMEEQIMNTQHFNDPNLLLYKYFQYVDKHNGKKKLTKLMTLLCSKKLREYNDKRIYFYNSSVHIHNFVFSKFLHLQSKTYLSECAQKEKKENIIKKYSLYTDFFLYALDFYVFHLSKKYTFLSIEQLNVLSNIYANVSISKSDHERNNNSDSTCTGDLSDNAQNNEGNSHENDVNNKICLLYVYISKCIILQTYSHVVGEIQGCKKKETVEELTLNNYTNIFNILLIKFNLFFLNYKVLNDCNKKIIFDGISKYIDSLLLFQIKQNREEVVPNTNNHRQEEKSLLSNDFFTHIYKKECSENVDTYSALYREIYNGYKKYPSSFLTYLEHSVFSLFKYLYRNIPWVKREKTKLWLKGSQKDPFAQEHLHAHYKKCFVNRKYNDYGLTLSENFLSNVILLSIYVQNCFPVLFSLMQKMEKRPIKRGLREINKWEKRAKGEDKWAARGKYKQKGGNMANAHVYRRYVLLPNRNNNSGKFEKRKQSHVCDVPFCENHPVNNFIQEESRGAHLCRNANPFVPFLFCIYDMFKERISLYSDKEEEKPNCIIRCKKNIEESIIYDNIKKNKNNKIRTSLTHYYVSSNLKKINEADLYNEKNILTFYCDIYFKNNIIEVDGPKHFFIYYKIKNKEQNYFTSFIEKNEDIFVYKYVFPFFFHNTKVLQLENNQEYYLYNDKSIKKNFFLYIHGYFVKHINYNDRDITSYKYLYDILFKKSDFHAVSYTICSTLP